jgi:hypothetical protein
VSSGLTVPCNFAGGNIVVIEACLEELTPFLLEALTGRKKHNERKAGI